MIMAIRMAVQIHNICSSQHRFAGYYFGIQINSSTTTFFFLVIILAYIVFEESIHCLFTFPHFINIFLLPNDILVCSESLQLHLDSNGSSYSLYHCSQNHAKIEDVLYRSLGHQKMEDYYCLHSVLARTSQITTIYIFRCAVLHCVEFLCSFSRTIFCSSSSSS